MAAAVKKPKGKDKVGQKLPKLAVAEVNGGYVIVSGGALNILRAVKDKALTYLQIQEAADIPANSVYVFCKRLYDSKLITKSRNDDTTIVTVSMAEGVALHNATKVA